MSSSGPSARPSPSVSSPRTRLPSSADRGASHASAPRTGAGPGPAMRSSSPRNGGASSPSVADLTGHRSKKTAATNLLDPSAPGGTQSSSRGKPEPVNATTNAADVDLALLLYERLGAAEEALAAVQAQCATLEELLAAQVTNSTALSTSIGDVGVGLSNLVVRVSVTSARLDKLQADGDEASAAAEGRLAELERASKERAESAVNSRSGERLEAVEKAIQDRIAAADERMEQMAKTMQALVARIAELENAATDNLATHHAPFKALGDEAHQQLSRPEEDENGAVEAAASSSMVAVSVIAPAKKRPKPAVPASKTKSIAAAPTPKSLTEAPRVSESVEREAVIIFDEVQGGNMDLGEAVKMIDEGVVDGEYTLAQATAIKARVGDLAARLATKSSQAAAAVGQPGIKKGRSMAEKLEAIRVEAENKYLNGVLASDAGGPPGSFRVSIPGIGGIGFKLLVLGTRAVVCSVSSDELAEAGVKIGHALVQVGDASVADACADAGDGKELEMIKALLDQERKESGGANIDCYFADNEGDEEKEILVQYPPGPLGISMGVIGDSVIVLKSSGLTSTKGIAPGFTIVRVGKHDVAKEAEGATDLDDRLHIVKELVMENKQELGGRVHITFQKLKLLVSAPEAAATKKAGRATLDGGKTEAARPRNGDGDGNEEPELAGDDDRDDDSAQLLAAVATIGPSKALRGAIASRRGSTRDEGYVPAGPKPSAAVVSAAATAAAPSAAFAFSAAEAASGGKRSLADRLKAKKEAEAAAPAQATATQQAVEVQAKSEAGMTAFKQAADATAIAEADAVAAKKTAEIKAKSEADTAALKQAADVKALVAAAKAANQVAFAAEVKAKAEADAAAAKAVSDKAARERKAAVEKEAERALAAEQAAFDRVAAQKAATEKAAAEKASAEKLSVDAKVAKESSATIAMAISRVSASVERETQDLWSDVQTDMPMNETMAIIDKRVADGEFDAAKGNAIKARLQELQSGKGEAPKAKTRPSPVKRKTNEPAAQAPVAKETTAVRVSESAEREAQSVYEEIKGGMDMDEALAMIDEEISQGEFGTVKGAAIKARLQELCAGKSNAPPKANVPPKPVALASAKAEVTSPGVSWPPEDVEQLAEELFAEMKDNGMTMEEAVNMVDEGIVDGEYDKAKGSAIKARLLVLLNGHGRGANNKTMVGAGVPALSGPELADQFLRANTGPSVGPSSAKVPAASKGGGVRVSVSVEREAQEVWTEVQADMPMDEAMAMIDEGVADGEYDAAKGAAIKARLRDLHSGHGGGTNKTMVGTVVPALSGPVLADQLLKSKAGPPSSAQAPTATKGGGVRVSVSVEREAQDVWAEVQDDLPMDEAIAMIDEGIADGEYDAAKGAAIKARLRDLSSGKK